MINRIAGRLLSSDRDGEVLAARTTSGAPCGTPAATGTPSPINFQFRQERNKKSRLSNSSAIEGKADSSATRCVTMALPFENSDH
jgi:hypothetical protein